MFPDLVLKDGVLLQEPNLLTQRPGLVLLRGLGKVFHLRLHPALHLRDVTLELEGRLQVFEVSLSALVSVHDFLLEVNDFGDASSNEVRVKMFLLDQFLGVGL